MTVRVFRSSNLGMPQVSGVVGGFIPVLDLLVNGGSAMGVVSITRSGSIATVTTALSHGLTNGQLTTISGANEADYNGEFVPTITSATTFTFVVANAPATPATGTLTAKISGCGWTKPFTSTNLAMYKQPTGSNGMYLRIDDTVATTARIRGFETATDVTGGAAAFPTEAQLAGGGYVLKSSVADATTRPWVLICNGNAFLLWINTGNIGGAVTAGMMTAFGDFSSLKSGDVFNTLLSCAISAALSDSVASLTALAAASPASWIARSHTQIGSSVTFGKHVDSVKSAAATVAGSAGMAYPSPVDGGVYISPMFLTEAALSVFRGTLNGVYAPCHSRPFSNGDTFIGTGQLVGKTFEAFNLNAAGQVFVETSNTW